MAQVKKFSQGFVGPARRPSVPTRAPSIHLPVHPSRVTGRSHPVWKSTLTTTLNSKRDVSGGHITKTELGNKLATLRAPTSLKPVCHELRKTMLRPYTTHVQEHVFNKGEEGAERHLETYSGLP